MAGRALVIDANVLLRAVLSRRASDVLARFAATATFLAPDVAYAEAEEHMAAVVHKRGAPTAAVQPALAKLQSLRSIVSTSQQGWRTRVRARGVSSRRLGGAACSQLFRNASKSALNWSLWVSISPCGAPG